MLLPLNPMDLDVMGSGFMIVYNHVELDFGSVFVLDAQAAGPWIVFFISF